jgi:hypothetical protein
MRTSAGCEWQNDALCAKRPFNDTTSDAEFQHTTGSSLRPSWTESSTTAWNDAQNALARRICASCPVAEQCLVYALRLESAGMASRYGIYGGTTPGERERVHQRTLRRKRRLEVEARIALKERTA